MPSPSPRGTYQVISQALRERIAAGAYADGVPSEAEIGREFGVARTTVRRALRALEEAGDVKAVAGVGRAVAGGADAAPYERIEAEAVGLARYEAELIHLDQVGDVLRESLDAFSAVAVRALDDDGTQLRG
ncbi:GntR family transcriptional regulator [Streptomyces sp. NBC_01353]|uniref:GntR family transcriptional regulator n=1 Tax=Streptomyces sp. NBC_01353 TaxID=2903835 RepID=UPI002E37F571|nr:GntR family transcriptional regulator [Streptomyces sp. NBC_01353]